MHIVSTSFQDVLYLFVVYGRERGGGVVQLPDDGGA